MLEIKSDKILPSISVIIPLYNAEKYIAQCLGSILSQTFQDFEVIVVDDCSTDNSVAIVENMTPKFNGKLHLVKRNKNSGGAAIPRNIGMRLSRGKYISFIDNDDLFTTNALKDMYEAAEQTQADVIHAEKLLVTKDGRKEIDDNTPLKIERWEVGLLVDKITFESYDLGERIQRYSKKQIFWNVWNKLFRREFLAENYIEFPDYKIADDMIFCFYCLCLAKNYVRIPNVFNIFRTRNDSFFRRQISLEEESKKWVKIIAEGTRLMDNFMKKIDYFKEHPEFRFMVIDFFVNENINWMNQIFATIPVYKLDSIIRKELSNDLNENLALTSYLFNRMAIYRLQLSQANKQILLLQKELEEKK